MRVKQLPPLLEPWRPWLSLFPADLAEPLGAILLRLHPQIGPLRSAPARADALPEGVGSIVQRGPYERLLISEWAYADAEPDEFIRRAASGELMFAGPEPAARQRSRRCLALFDAGPAQLGEPRLLHLALFILLSRRAEEAGAGFAWGVLQAPGVVYDAAGRDGLQKLLKARTLAAASPEQLKAWGDAVDHASDDAWMIGGHGQKAPAGVRGQVAIRRQIVGDELDVAITMHLARRQISLPLPPPELAIRLLRSPFEALASRAELRQKEGRPSLLLAPRFAVSSSMLAVPQLDGGIYIYPVPHSLKSKPGAPRRHAAPSRGAILGAGIYGKSLASLASDNDELRFKGFPSEGFSSKYASIARPPVEQFRAPPQRARWLQIFFLKRQLNERPTGPRKVRSEVFALDMDRKLVCWSRESSMQSGTATNSPIECRTVGRDVIGAEQTEGRILFGVASDAGTEVYGLAAGSAQLATLPYRGTELLFGGLAHWPRTRGHGLLALRVSETDWWVGSDEQMAMIKIDDAARVIGVAGSARHKVFGLVVLTAKKRIIELRALSGVRVLVRSAEDIAQASVCARSGNIAWVGARSHRLSVQGIDEEKPYLTVLAAGADGDE
jgi:hypothetical protein